MRKHQEFGLEKLKLFVSKDIFHHGKEVNTSSSLITRLVSHTDRCGIETGTTVVETIWLELLGGGFGGNPFEAEPVFGKALPQSSLKGL